MVFRIIVGCLAVISISISNSSSAAVDILSEHYKLAVGQGECSTTVSTLTQKDMEAAYKVAVTADIGSSSLRADPKYVSGYNYDSFVPILERKHMKRLEDLFVPTSEPVKKRSRTEGDDKSRSPSIRYSQLEASDKKIITTSLTGESTFEGSFDFLIKQLQNINLWIVFLSHPDKDHINWLSTVFDKLATTTKLILIAGGEWFNPFSTEDIREVLGLVYAPDKQQRIFSFFPYEDGRLSHFDMAEWLQTNGASIRKKDPSTFCPRKELNGKRLDQFHGTLTELLDVYKKSILGLIGLSSENPLSKALINSILDKIYIWSLDNPIGNPNAQSIVWSHEVDDIGWTFVYTGDAENSTFEKIRASLKFSKKDDDQPTDVVRKRYKTGTTAAPNLIMMQGMHHGSLENVSPIAMELFCPNAIAFSSGNGASFAHPSIKAIQKYETLFRSQYSENFWSSYSLENPYSFAAFSQRGEGEQGKALPTKIQEQKALFLCTNAYGTIKITAESISTSYNETPEYVGYYDLHSYEIEGTLASLLERLNGAEPLEVRKLGLSHDEVYAREEFRSAIRESSLTKSEQTAHYLLVKLDGNEEYALKAIQKTRKENGKDKPYIYFYVLKKLISTDTKVVPVE